MRKLIKGALLAIAMVGMFSPTAGPALAQDAPAAKAAHYSVSETLVGKLLDDPAAVAILQRLIPTVYANDMFKTMGRDLTLKAIQQYEPDALSDANLAKIQAEFDKIPAK
jgi:hypothetical protein